jgi:hypothetical protein
MMKFRLLKIELGLMMMKLRFQGAPHPAAVVMADDWRKP